METKREESEELKKGLSKKRLKKRKRQRLMLFWQVCLKTLKAWRRQQDLKKSQATNKSTCTRIQEKELPTCLKQSLLVYISWMQLKTSSMVGDGSVHKEE
jgi:hypothetical protein